MKKNIAVSDVGVACQRKINIVGMNMFGSFTVAHRQINWLLDVSKNPRRGLAPDNSSASRSTTVDARRRSSFTRIATTDVIKGKRAVIANTNLQKI